MEKLKGLKVVLSRWNKEVFGHVDIQKAAIGRDISELDKKEELQALSADDFSRRSQLKDQLTNIIIQEQRMWIQKGKIRWLEEGDENSHFFHRWTAYKMNRAFTGDIESV